MQNNCTKKYLTTGVSFIEILVLLLLISLFASFAIPRFIGGRKGAPQKQFFTLFATLISDSVYQAVTTKKIHQIYFDLAGKEILVKIYHPMPDETDKHKQFKFASSESFNNKIRLPNSFILRNFYMTGEELLKGGSITNDAWFYVMPDGTSQPVIINIEDENETANNLFSITVNPFYSQVKLHDTFSKP